MGKNLVLTISIGDVYQKISEFTHPTIKKYAERIGADFLSIGENNCSSPHWEKFQIYNLLNKYDRIIYMDTDILVREDCPNLFDIVPADQLGIFNEFPFTEGRHISLIESCKDYGVTLGNWKGTYYNTGVMVVPRQWKFLFKKPEKELFNFYEQGYINARIHQELEKVGNEHRVFSLPYKFNRMTCMDKFTGEERFASYVMHYAGFPNLNFVLDIIKSDTEKWKASNGKYEYKRHILIEVQGGLGDQLEAQPGVRYLSEKIYKDEDIIVLTHYPYIFEGINGIEVYLHGSFQRKADTPYFYINTLPGPDTPMWNYVSNLLCHTVDYCAMAMMRRTLPEDEKNIILNIKEEDFKEVYEICGEKLDDLILVHPGKHWESKTFPVDWWQKVIDGLQKDGMKVCLIGKNELTRGALPVIARKGMIDTRDLLTLEELSALMSKAKVVLSNDSAPVHLAGAFDNWIILVPSCKHPDHIIPYRNGSIKYKSKAIYKKLALDDIPQAPTEVHGSSGKDLVKPWEEYLPSVEEIVKEVKNCFNGD